MSEVQIVFTPAGRRGRVKPGTSVLDAARQLGVDIDSICGGRGICGRCQVEVGSGTFAGLDTDASHVSELNDTEMDYAARRGLEPGRRLSCSMHVLGDVAIEVPETSRVHRQVVRKRAELTAISVDPVLKLHYVEVAGSSLGTDTGDLERLFDALESEWGLGTLEVDPAVLRRLQPAVADGPVTVAVHDESLVTAVWPGFHDEAYGVAFDVGSTTVAGHLCNLETGEILASAGTMNPQIRFGEDLMSRVSYVMLNPGGDAEMTSAVREAMNGLIAELTDSAGVATDDVLEFTIVGNPIMHHLVLGIDPTPLGTAPFTLATSDAVRIKAAELDLNGNAGARVYVLPCIAGHVGADTSACILSEGPHRADGVQLLVDVGTNAEIVLGSNDRLLAASSPTGPAFEGAQISGGQRATPGAIEKVRVDRSTLEPRFKVVGCDLWSDEDGFAEAISATGVTGICGSGIIEAVAELFLAGAISHQGLIVGETQSRRVIQEGRTYSYVLVEADPRLVVTQNDVRAIQLAKGALRAGAQLLMDHLGVDDVDQIRLAGAFGSHIDPLHAMVLGLIPDCDLDRVSAAGNAAGTGAMMALLSGEHRTEIERVVRSVEKIETAVEPGFQGHFVGAMAIPHSTASTHHLSSAVDLPEPAEATGVSGRGGSGGGDASGESE